jgi:hypothetical protein
MMLFLGSLSYSKTTVQWSDRLVQTPSPSSLSNVSEIACYTLSDDRHWFLATFHKTIELAVPHIIALLVDSHSDARSAGARAVGQLSNQRK